jgi:pyruvate dehydrogenase E1 component
LFGSGAILREALAAQEVLDEQFGVAAEVWSATSYNLVRRDALACERFNLLNPGAPPRVPYLRQLLSDEPYPIVATGDHMKSVSDQIAPWAPNGMLSLGTDGFGRSEAREDLRAYFEVDRRFVVLGALTILSRRGQMDVTRVSEAAKALGIRSDKPDPMSAPKPDTLVGD